MADSTILGITKMTESAEDNYVRFDEAVDEFEQSQEDTVDVDCTAGGSIVVSSTDYLRNKELHLTGTPGAGFTLVLPDGKRVIYITNDSGQTATVDTTTGSAATPSITTANGSVVISRGTELRAGPTY